MIAGVDVLVPVHPVRHRARPGTAPRPRAPRPRGRRCRRGRSRARGASVRRDPPSRARASAGDSRRPSSSDASSLSHSWRSRPGSGVSMTMGHLCAKDGRSNHVKLSAREGAPRRVGRCASTRSRGRSRGAPRWTELHCAPGNPGIAPLLRDCHPVRAEDAEGLLGARPRARRSTSSSSVRRRRSSRASPTHLRHERHRGLRPEQPRRRDRRLEVVREGGHGRRGRADAPASSPVARAPCVIKADGLAAGKGVFVCRTQEELDSALPAAAALGQPLVIEELLEGPEVSVFALVRRRRRSSPCRPRRTSSASSTATTGRTPAAWALTRPLPTSTSRSRRFDPPARARGARAPRRAVRRLPVRGPDAHRRAARACSSSTAASATRRRSCSCRGSTATSSPRSPPRRAGDLGGVDAVRGADDAAVTVVLRRGHVPGAGRQRHADRRHRGRRSRRRTRLPRRHGAARRPARHERRPHPRRHRHRPHGRRSARARLRRGVDRISFRRRAVPHGHRGARLARRWLSAVVGILVGSESDRERMQGALRRARQARHRVRVRRPLGAPAAGRRRRSTAGPRATAGCKVLICGAGLAAALPGVAAAHTDLPVIGVPLRSSLSVLDGLDALLSIAQMPPGVPVAAVGVDNARNAAVARGADPRVHERARRARRTALVAIDSVNPA